MSKKGKSEKIEKKTTHTAEVLENILAHGHGGGNFRRLLIMEIAKEEKRSPVPCCGHACCCNYTPPQD